MVLEQTGFEMLCWPASWWVWCLNLFSGDSHWQKHTFGNECYIWGLKADECLRPAGEWNSGSLHFLLACTDNLWIGEFYSVSFKNWAEVIDLKGKCSTDCVFSHFFFLFVLFWVIFWIFSGTLLREKSVTKHWTFGKLAPNDVFASKHSTGKGSHGTAFCREDSLSTPEPTPLSKVQQKEH